MINSHYVPRLTLRRFSDKLCLFNVKTGEYKENIKIEDAFSEYGFYSDEVEDKLNKRIESQFGNLFANKLAKLDREIQLSRTELRLVKKFILVSVIRSMGSEEYLQKEKTYYEDADKFAIEHAEEFGLSIEDIKNNPIEKPFEEKIIDGETPFEYWMRTLNVILDTDGSVEEILEHPDKTYPAHRWAEVINNGYLAFWDSEFNNEEFVITDIGMTSENELGWNGVTQHNIKKTSFLMDLLKNEKDPNMQREIVKIMHMHHNFTENFMMFPISAKRMIVEIDPFYRFRSTYKKYYDMPDLASLSLIPNEDLFEPNDAKYVYKQDGKKMKYHEDDRYIYTAKKLSKREIRYCNELFLDRINTYVGFSSLRNVIGSFVSYKRANSFPFIPRVDYKEIYDLINQRYDSSIDLDTIAGVKR